MRSALLASVLLLGACDWFSGPPSPRSSAPAVTAAPARSDGAAPADMANGAVVSVDVRGRVTVRPEDGGVPTGRVLLALTDGPCFRPGTHWLALAVPAADGTYSLSAFPPNGVRVEVCGAVLPGGRRRTGVWGRAEQGPFPLDRPSRLSGVDLTLARAPVEIEIPEALRLP